MLDLAIHHRLAGFELDVTLQAPTGVTALFGPSGAGKTTLINVLAGLIRPDKGHARIGDWTLFDHASGVDLAPHRRRIGYVFQDHRLFPHLSVRRNLGYGRWFQGMNHEAQAFGRIVEMLGLDALLDRRPAGLSGGEKARVAIGRALLAEPRLLLLDEPLAALDYRLRADILPYLERLRDHAGMPILYVSHEASEVARLATTVAMIDRGRLLQIGPAAQILADPDMAQALGPREAGALLSAKVLRHHDDGLTELTHAGGAIFVPRIAAAPGAEVRLRIAADDVILARTRPPDISALTVLYGHILRIDPGPDARALVQIDLGDSSLLARVTRRSVTALGLEVGHDCHALVKAAAIDQRDIGSMIAPTTA